MKRLVERGCVGNCGRWPQHGNLKPAKTQKKAGDFSVTGLPLKLTLWLLVGQAQLGPFTGVTLLFTLEFNVTIIAGGPD